jgi:SAM-dependent methyltransferase
LRPSKKVDLKYFLYERSVQTPELHIPFFVGIYKELRGKYARRLREDFCGTFRLSCEWVNRNRRNTAVGVDLDPEPLEFGRRHHLPKLNAEQRSRLSILQEDVLAVDSQKSDVILACNFSFYIFKRRELLVRYFRAAYRSLAKDGIFILDLAGGPGMIEAMRERKRIRDKKLGDFTYVWHQQEFDPVTHDARYAIHFTFPPKADGRETPEMKNAFTYDWRLWTIPEVREALAEAGFPRTEVYWETEHKGEGTGEYVLSKTGDNAYSWVAYVVGLR